MDRRQETELSVLTLNVWGLPSPLSKEKDRRIEEIGKFLLIQDYDVVCLQELWCKNDYFKLKEICRRKFLYSRYYYSGVFGSGLAIFSKWQMTKTLFTFWSVNGYFHNVHHGDWFGGKGVALAQLNVNDYIVNVYNVHLIAKYNEEDIKDIYRTHRVIQAFDTGLWIDLTSSGADVTILCGDLNDNPKALCTKLVKLVPKLHDAYHAVETNGKEDFGTYGWFRNSFSPKQEKHSLGERIDYILYKSRPNMKATALHYDLPLITQIPGTEFSYSDHEAVEAKIRINVVDGVYDDGESGMKEVDSLYTILDDAIEICTTGEQTVMKNCNKYIAYIIAMLFLLSYCLTLSDKLVFISCIIFVPIIMYLIYLVTIGQRLEINGILGAKIRIENFRNYI